MEYLDVYDEKQNFIRREKRNIVHRDALWHKTVHCWLYDSVGNIYFQTRSDEKRLYTTASGHVLAGETIQQAFGREVMEEVGIHIDYESSVLVQVVKFMLDKRKEDGTLFRDRAFANVYACIYDGEDSDFDYDEKEVCGIVKVNVKDTLALLKNEKGFIMGTVIEKDGDNTVVSKRRINFLDFLVNEGETAIGKYGEVLNKILELTSKLEKTSF